MKKEKSKQGAMYLMGANTCLVIGLLAGQIQNSRLENILSKNQKNPVPVIEKQSHVENFDKPQVNRNSVENNSDIDCEIIAGIESSYNPLAISSAGAKGLMQIMPGTLKEWNNFNPNEKYTLKDLDNPKINEKIGNWYMNKRIPQMLEHYNLEDTTENRLASYNWGIGNVKKINGITDKNLCRLPKETKDYIKKYEDRNS